MGTDSFAPARLAVSMADWVVGLRWQDVPENVRTSTVESTFQSVAGGVAGLDMPETRTALAWARATGESGPATILGDGRKVPLQTATFVNSVLWCSLEQQEMHVPSRTHPHEVIVPVALTLGEQLHVDGVALLEAILAGVEITIALGRTAVEITPDIVQGMPNTTSIFAGIGAAAAAARLLRLDAPTTALALAHAANFGAGFTECLRQGTVEYHWSLGDASVKGLLAAQLAAAGAEATTLQFEGGSGLFAALTGLSAAHLQEADLHGRVAGRLGNHWGMPEHIYKRYPVHFPSLPYLDGTKGLREKHDIRAEEVTAIRLRINAWIELCDGANLGPYTGREATRGAVAYQVGTMLVRGRFDHDIADVLDDPAVIELVGKTTIEHFADVSNDSWELVRIEIDDRAGNTYVYDSTVEGMPDYRLPMSELRILAHDALVRVLDPAAVSSVLNTLENLETCADVAELTTQLVRAG